MNNIINDNVYNIIMIFNKKSNYKYNIFIYIIKKMKLKTKWLNNIDKESLDESLNLVLRDYWFNNFNGSIEEKILWDYWWKNLIHFICMRWTWLEWTVKKI